MSNQKIRIEALTKRNEFERERREFLKELEEETHLNKYLKIINSIEAKIY